MSNPLVQTTLRYLATLKPPATGRAWQSAPHPAQPLLATACGDKTIRIYSLTSFTLLSTITGGHRRSVRCCAWKPNTPPDTLGILATGSFDATAVIWTGRQRQGGSYSVNEDADDEGDVEDYRFAVILEGHDSEIKSISWSVHGNFLATCSRDKSVWIWEALQDSHTGMISGRLTAAEDDDDEDNYETAAVMQEHEGDVKTVAWHPLEESCLASGSYDDNVRVWREDIDGEWGCVAICEGHQGTVWSVCWETQDLQNGKAQDTDTELEVSGPRLMSCSDDLTIRTWRRKPKRPPKTATGPRIPSTIRSTSDDEEWFEEGQLPTVHDRAIYSISWSPKTQRVVSCGGDGRIVVYEECVSEAQHQDPKVVPEIDGKPTHVAGTLGSSWKVLAQIENAHGVFEINHVCWAARADKGKTKADEEVIVTTGDDGEVKVWTIEEADLGS